MGADSLVELKQVVRFCNEELKLLAKLKADGAASAMEVNRARHRAMIAEYCLAGQQDDKTKLLSEITKAAERSGDELMQIRRLRAQGFADSLDVYFAQRNFLSAKLLLAIPSGSLHRLTSWCEFTTRCCRSWEAIGAGGFSAPLSKVNENAIGVG